MTNENILPIKPPLLPKGYFDKKGKFISIRRQQTKILKKIKQISGVSNDFLGNKYD